jgi:hypothetical protein
VESVFTRRENRYEFFALSTPLRVSGTRQIPIQKILFNFFQIINNFTKLPILHHQKRGYREKCAITSWMLNKVFNPAAPQPRCDSDRTGPASSSHFYAMAVSVRGQDHVSSLIIPVLGISFIANGSSTDIKKTIYIFWYRLITYARRKQQKNRAKRRKTKKIIMLPGNGSARVLLQDIKIINK